MSGKMKRKFFVVISVVVVMIFIYLVFLMEYHFRGSGALLLPVIVAIGLNGG